MTTTIERLQRNYETLRSQTEQAFASTGLVTGETAKFKREKAQASKALTEAKRAEIAAAADRAEAALRAKLKPDESEKGLKRFEDERWQVRGEAKREVQEAHAELEARVRAEVEAELKSGRAELAGAGANAFGG